ncbi:hypothetical protein ACSBPU_05735 [Parapusillimonas sp. JC17]|uniref:hypothetical protein n=1 Tax=Parapusillimonas sp. JC17 TaxID=3445768 RepID=UPI003FA01BDB
MRIQVNPKALRAVAHFRAAKDIRPYLRGVHVEASHEHTVLVATNGQALAAHHSDVANDVPVPVRFQIPADTVALLVKGRSSASTLVLEKDDLAAGTWRVATQHGWLEFAPDHDRYPDWRRVFPEVTTGEPCIMNPEVTMAIWKAAAEFGIRGLGQKGKLAVRIGLNGLAGASIAQFDVIPGLIMGFMGMSDANDTPYVMRRPSWVVGTFAPSMASVAVKDVPAESLV